jgi:hypothetical protein
VNINTVSQIWLLKDFVTSASVLIYFGVKFFLKLIAVQLVKRLMVFYGTKRFMCSQRPGNYSGTK